MFEKEKNCLYLKYETSTIGGEICAGEEEESWPNYEPLYTTFDLLSCDIVKHENDYTTESVIIDFIPKINQEVYVVLVRYSSGNTFGRHNGCWYIEGIYKNKKQAIEIKKDIEEKKYSGYVPWTGYFEYLESCEVEAMIIKD